MGKEVASCRVVVVVAVAAQEAREAREARETRETREAQEEATAMAVLMMAPVVIQVATEAANKLWM